MPSSDPAARPSSPDDRPATILFADILGFGQLARQRGPDEAFALVTRGLRRLDEIARRHGGAVDKYLGDCLMAAFGFPVASDRAERDALTAALAMRRAVHDTRRELGLGPELDVRIGVATGPILAGSVDGAVIREFAVMGDAVNVAARLKAKAPPGSIYVGPHARRAAGDAFELTPLPRMALKGRRETLQPFALHGHRHRGRRRVGESVSVFSDCLGREAELARLEERLEAVARGHGGLAWIEGEAGIGKSRLVAELAARHPELPFEEVPAERFEAALAGPGPARVLVLDDAQDLPPAPADALRGWLPLSGAVPVLVAVLARPDPPPHVAAVRAAAEGLGDRFLALALGPLDGRDARRLMDAVAGDDPLSEETRALVAARAGGNPSHLVQAVYLADALRADAARADAHADRGDEAERRRTTVLFADLTGFTGLVERGDPRTVHALVTDCLDLLSEVARRHGGSVEKHLGDCILATFGAPVAIEDAPRAAVNAALEMRQQVEAFNAERGVEPPLRVHVGIDTGLGIAGDVSGPVIREFTLMGESVARAAQLEDASPPGAIWVGPETERATRDVFEYDATALPDGAPAFALRSGELHLHRDPAPRRRVASVLVGRDAELAALNEAVAGLAAGRGAAVSVVAEAGLGKSRLVEEMLAGLPEDVAWYKGRSLAFGRTRGFHPIADLLSRWCGVDERFDEAGAAERLAEACEAVMGDEAGEVLPFLATLMGLPPPERDRARLERMGGEALQRLVLGSVTRLVRRAAAQAPLVLVFEDLHWADLSSLELLESLLHVLGESPVLVLAMLRPHFAETGERFRAAARERLGPRYREVELPPLPDDAALAMLRNLFQGGDVPPALLAAVRDRARGNPFYVEEAVRTLLDTGVLVERGDALEATARIDEVEIPGTLQELVMARVDRLARPLREALRAASAIGSTFQRDVLAEVLGKDDLPERLVALEAAELVQARARSGEYRFKHPLIQEVVYDSLVAERREALHRAIGRAVEARLSPAAPGYHAMLAYHYSRGRDLERAEAHLFRAGDEAARSAASDEALEFFREALELYRDLHGEDGDPTKLAVLERAMALALANRGHYVEAVAHFDAALRHRGVPVTDSRVRLAARLARDLAVVLARLYLPPLRHRRRPAATEQQKAVQELIYDRARAQTTSAMDRYLFDWMDGLRRLADADPRTLPLAGGQFASTVGIFSYGGVSFAVSERFLALARELVDESDPTERMIYGFMSYFHHVLAGDWSDGHELPEDLVEDRIRNGQLFDVTNYLAFCAEKRVFQGRFDEAVDVCRRLEEIADLYQYDLALSSLHGLTAFLYLEQEMWEEAARAADVHYTEHDDPLLNVLALGTKAKAQLLAGDRDGAVRTLETAERRLAAAPGVVPPYQKSAVLRSRLLVEVDALERGDGRPRRARAAARAARSAAARVACRRPEVARLEAALHALAGRRRAADEAWERAHSEAEALGMRPELGRIERDRRRHATDEGPA